MTSTPSSRRRAVFASMIAGGLVLLAVLAATRAFRSPEPSITMQLVASPSWELAFARDPGLPGQRDDWAAVHGRGGVHVGLASLRLTIRNPTSHELSIRAIALETIEADTATRYEAANVGRIRAEPPPARGFVAGIISQSEGATFPLFALVEGEPGWQVTPPLPPYFDEHGIDVESGRDHTLAIEVQSEPERVMVRYRIRVTAVLDGRRVAMTTPQSFALVGAADTAEDHYAHRYARGVRFLICTRTLQQWLDVSRGTFHDCATTLTGDSAATARDYPSTLPPGWTDCGDAQSLNVFTLYARDVRCGQAREVVRRHQAACAADGAAACQSMNMGCRVLDEPSFESVKVRCDTATGRFEWYYGSGLGG